MADDSATEPEGPVTGTDDPQAATPGADSASEPGDERPTEAAPEPDDQWARISAEVELRPDRGVVDEVPVGQLTPEPDVVADFDPIELNEVPLEAEAEPVPEPDEEPASPPIQIVPFHATPMPQAGPDIISAAPFEVQPEVTDAAVVDDLPEMITDVPVPHADPVEVVADLPDQKAVQAKTPWWKLMLGGGESRAQRRSAGPKG